MVRAAAAQPGVPRLLRVLNDRNTLELMLADGAMTRAELGRRTGVSRVTASEALGRLQVRGLVDVVGRRSAGPGPDAEVYAVHPGVGRALGIDVRADSVAMAVGAVTGETLTTVVDDSPSLAVAERVERAVAAVLEACSSAGDDVLAAVAAVPGVVDPGTHDIRFSHDLPDAPLGLREQLEARLSAPVVLENDGNAAAVAEGAVGVAVGCSDVVVVWLGEGIGCACVVDGRLHRGSSGAAGEIGYLPVPGARLPEHLDRTTEGPYLRLVGVPALAEVVGAPAGAVAAAVRTASGAVLDEVARRVALGVASVCSGLDPELVVLSGEIGVAGGERLAGLVADHVGRLAPVRPVVTASTLGESAVLEGATRCAVLSARQSLVARLSGPADE